MTLYVVTYASVSEGPFPKLEFGTLGAFTSEEVAGFEVEQERLRHSRRSAHREYKVEEVKLNEEKSIF